MILTEASPGTVGDGSLNAATGIKRKHISYGDVDEGNPYQDDDEPMKKENTSLKLKWQSLHHYQ
jgi:hypothetical protein